MNPIALDTALVRVAVALDDQEGSSLKQALERQFGRPLALRVDIDPRILGGVWVQVGDVIVDGSLRGRLEALRHHLRLRARTLMALDDAEGRANPAGAENP